MSTQYVDYLKGILNSLKSKGIELDVDLDCEKSRLPEQVMIIEEFLYFNNILKRADSIYKLEDIYDLPDTSSQDVLRKQIYEQYEEEWRYKLEHLTEQPEDAGQLNLPICTINNGKIEEFTESLGLITSESSIDEEQFSTPYQFKPSSGSVFDNDEDE